MRILVACEFSGIVRDAFIAKGHDVISCDLLPTERPGPHYQGDVYDILFKHRWDMIIAFPECTKVCVSGNHVYAKGKPKYQQRLDAAKWTEQFWNDCKRMAGKVCFENSKGVLPTLTNMPTPVYVQPHGFGHDASKETGLFLHNLEPLRPTKHVPGRLVCCGLIISESTGKYGCPNCCGDKAAKRRWANQTNSGQNKLGPSPDRWKLRSKTYQGIADAMADQWG